MSATMGSANWPFFAALMVKGADWPFFTNDELASKDVGYAIMYEPFMRRLVALRLLIGLPLPVTSGYRTEAKNREVHGAPHSAHLYGCAVAIATAGLDVHQLVGLAYNLGFTGIHVKNHGPIETRFVHLDYITDADVPRELEDARPYFHTYAR